MRCINAFGLEMNEALERAPSSTTDSTTNAVLLILTGMYAHLLRMVYVSRATARLTADVLQHILAAARSRNEERGVTGVLCAGQGYFVQVLEGHQNDVLSIYTSIMKDGRHTEVNLLSISLVSARAFPNWSMAHIDGDEMSPSVLQSLVSEAVVERDSSISLKVLKSAVAALRGPG